MARKTAAAAAKADNNNNIIPLKRTGIQITRPNMQRAVVKIIGTAPYVSNKFGKKELEKMYNNQLAGSTTKKGTRRDPKDFDALFKGSMHVSRDGWYGIPAAAFRNGLISVCKICGFHMTKAKLCVFVIHDGLDETGYPLCRIKGKPIRRDHPVRMADGSTNITSRGFFDDWSVDVMLEWDADWFTAEDIMNMMMRMGIQVGIGAGRPDSKTSAGMGWGTFKVEVA